MHRDEAMKQSTDASQAVCPRTAASRSLRWLIAALCAAVVVFGATAAAALDKDSIVQMTEMGLDESAIMGAIDSADDLGLDEDDIEALEDQGVSDEVIAHLHRRGHVEGEEPDEEEVAQQEDEPDDPAPAPAPGPAPAEAAEEEVDDEFEDLDEEEREELIQQRAREILEQEEQEEQRRQEMEEAAARMDRADNMVDAGENMEAARIYLAFLDYEPEHGSEEWYRATFGLAKALVQEGIYSGAADPLREVLMIGTEGEHFQEAFGMLETLTREIGYNDPTLAELTQFDLSATSDRFRERFNYYMGKFFYDDNRMEEALRYLEDIPDTAPEYPEARYLAGVAMLDPAVDDIPGALRHFEDAVRAAEAAIDEEGNRDIQQLGQLALARVYFEVGFFDVALYYYEQIPSESARHADAMFESAWSFFMKNDFERALGAFHSLHSPYYAGRYYPELYILEATAYLNMCNFEKSRRAVEEFEDLYLDQRQALENFLEETTDPEDYWALMENAYSAEGNSQVPELFTNAVLENLTFYNIFQVVRSLEAERDALKANIDALGEFGETVLARVENQLEMNIREGGIVVHDRLNEVDTDLRDWESNARQIEIDISRDEREEMQRRIQNPDYEGLQAEAGTTLMIVADDWQAWPFEGEYWLDEVDSYRSQMRTECIEP